MKKSSRCMIGVFMMAAALCAISGCGEQDISQTVTLVETQENQQTVSTEEQGGNQGTANGAASGEDLDKAEPDPADDSWYMKGNVYTDENGNRLEVFFDDEGMLEFAVNGLSLYYTTADSVQFENNWRIYECNEGITVVYYPGDPAHLEIYDGEYAGLYTQGGDKVK